MKSNRHFCTLVCASGFSLSRTSGSDLGWALGFELGFSYGVVLGSLVGSLVGYSILNNLGLAL